MAGREYRDIASPCSHEAQGGLFALPKLVPDGTAQLSSTHFDFLQ